MPANSISSGLTLDFALATTAEQSQRWLLSTMQKHGPELVTMLWRILGNEQDVCDAYQTTFLNLAHYPDKQKPENVKAYIFRSASNVAISMLRRKISERNITENIAANARPAAPCNEIDADYLQQRLREEISRLPDHLRDVVALRDLAELPYHKVASILGITSSTARVYRCKAVQLLALWMSKEK